MNLVEEDAHQTEPVTQSKQECEAHDGSQINADDEPSMDRIQFPRKTLDRFEEDNYLIEFGTIADQKCEAHYDTRVDADDDLGKDRIHFPQNMLYGRDAEIETLKRSFQRFSQQHQQQKQQQQQSKFEEGEKKDESTEKCDATKEEDMKCYDISEVIFLAGCSGTGKSALVKEFVRQIQEGSSSDVDFSFISGKYEEFKTANPFSAISASFGEFLIELLQGDPNISKCIRARLKQAGIQKGSQDGNILRTLIPEIDPFLFNDEDERKDSDESDVSFCSAIHDISAIQQAFRNLTKVISTKQSPVIIFLDDLQWADEASLEVISSLLSSDESSIGNLLFIGSYRSNEVDENHSLYKRMEKIEHSGKSSNKVHKLELFNLSPNDIGKFIADSIERPVEEIGTLTEVIYSKTLGNIFFVMNALEELVRRNALFFDMMCFQWRWGDLSRVALEGHLPNDVVEMVKSKIYSLPDILQEILILAAYTGSKINFETLLFLAENEEGIEIDSSGLAKLMETAVVEGVMLYSEKTRDYTFAHDRIREAAFLVVDPGEKQNNLRVRIANILLKQASSKKDDWMLFVAVSHLNLVPIVLVNADKLSRLNLRVAKLAISKAAFAEAVELLRTAWAILEKDNKRWDEGNYDFCLDLLNILTKMEHSLGNFDLSLAAANRIIENAKLLKDKFTAYRWTIECVQERGQDYALSLKKGVQILSLCGIKIKLNTTTTDLLIAKIRLKAALRNRSLGCLTKFPISNDSSLPYLLLSVGYIALFAKNHNVGHVIIIQIIRSALAEGMINECLTSVSMVAITYRKKKRYKLARKYINLSAEMMNIFSTKIVSEHHASTKMSFYADLAPLSLPFKEMTGKQFELQDTFFSLGLTNEGLASAMIASFCYFAASLPLNSIFDSRLLLNETKSKNMKRQGFVIIFQSHRQFLKNLQGKHGRSSNHNPTHLKGDTFDEEKILGTLEGNTKKMTIRDVSIFRLQLALIFDDVAIMDEMLQRLDSYPEHDGPVARQHLRMTYVGLAALTLAREKKNEKHLRWGLTALKHFKQLSKGGSPNAHPVYMCLKAVNQPKQEKFDKAIGVCICEGLLNLAAIMNERCSYYLALGNTKDARGGLQDEYLAQAVWHYESWGAMAKVADLKKQHKFLRNLKKKGPLSIALREANKIVKGSLGRRAMASS